jgi:hypothetical protein
LLGWTVVELFASSEAGEADEFAGGDVLGPLSAGAAGVCATGFCGGVEAVGAPTPEMLLIRACPFLFDLALLAPQPRINC